MVIRRIRGDHTLFGGKSDPSQKDKIRPASCTWRTRSPAAGANGWRQTDRHTGRKRRPHFTNCGELRDREVLLVRIPGIQSLVERGKKPADVYRQALWTLFGSLAALELRNEGLTSLAMPLLAATRGFHIKEIMRIMLESALDWLRVSRFMRSVNLYLIDRGMIEPWTTAMDEVLGRRVIDSAQNKVVHALREEILARLAALRGRYKADSWPRCSETLRTELGQKQIVLERVAAASRALIECIVLEILKADGVQQPKKGRLDDYIKELRQRNRIAPWILSHFDSLRIFGNAGVHLAGDVSYHPPRLREDDLTAILAALQRVLAFTQESAGTKTSP
jgi:hypothetical protein